MNLLNATRMQAGYTLGIEPDGRELVVVAVKGTFGFPERNGGVAELADDQEPLAEADSFTGEPGFSAMLYESDYAPRKPRCDVILNGSAYAPEKRQVQRLTVALRVGEMQKSFDVVGNRYWRKTLTGVAASSPEPFVRMPISYDNAFGGSDTSDPDPKNHRALLENPVGVGFHHNLAAEAVDGQPLPNTEEMGAPVKMPHGQYRPMAVGAVGRGWQPRIGFAGTYDQNWLDNVFPFLPPDFDERYYQCAPADQQIPCPSGGEVVDLINLTPQGRTAFRLPTETVPVLFIMKDWEEKNEQGRIDTIVIEPDQRRVLLTWRVCIPLRRNIFEISQIIVGEMTPAWHRARRLGKTYYPSLGDLVADRSSD